MFGRATITLDIGPHSSIILFCELICLYKNGITIIHFQAVRTYLLSQWAYVLIIMYKKAPEGG